MKVGLDELPYFLKRVLSDCSFRQDCTKYNNLFAMAATKVCNYCDDPGYTNRGPGTHSVTLTGRIVHFIRKINSSNKFGHCLWLRNVVVQYQRLCTSHSHIDLVVTR